ncbi:carbohydrate-binding wsc [Trichoderma cornu-damae]|uniref:Carbohydrate-binding wsc n=1 Tax=Trichoderma cornu-damae TaxID=654480 RepID=A0A9P8QN22_9HYPO|nr:carbohydrate-binding wsc [Trichoderma cornu-damae]
MASFRSNSLQRGCLILLVLAFTTLIPAIPVDVCSSFNTGETPLNVSIYQTNGLCSGFCIQKNYAFAITQLNSCWCSNYYPNSASTTDIKDCNTPCPAFPAENCGGHDLFGYILLNEVPPSGTKTAPPPTSTPSQASTVTVTDGVTKTVVQSTASKPGSTTSSSKSTSSSSSSSSSSSNSTSTSTSTSEAPTTSSSSSSSADPDGDHTGTGDKKSGLGTGGIVGIVVGVVGGVLVVAGAVLFWFLRRRRQKQDEYRDDPSVRGSSSGMMGSGPPDVSANGGSPASPASAANRNSTIQIDPRMDPFKQGLYIRGSHESLNTLRDDHDYSRRIQPPKVLRATNPDPEEG